MTDADLIARACETADGYLRLGNEVFDADGATFVRNTACPRKYDANHVESVTCSSPPEIDRLFARWDVEFPYAPYRRFDVDPRAPQQFVARLIVEGYEPSHVVELLLEGDLRATPKEHDIREMTTDADWAAHDVLQAQDWTETCEKAGRPVDLSVIPDFAISKRAKTPDVRFFLAYDDGAPRAFFSSWPGTNGVGVVEDLFTQKEYRHRGLATALIAHCVADARARGARPVLIGAAADDTPKHMYAAMGFRPLMMRATYFRRTAPAADPPAQASPPSP